MRSWLRSIGTALLLAALIDVIAVTVVAPLMPRVAGPPVFSEEREQRFAGVSHLTLTNTDGSIAVRAHNGPEVLVRAAVEVYAADKRPQAEVLAYTSTLCSGTVDNGVLTLSGEPPDAPDWAETRISYDIVVPEGTDLTIRSTNGNVAVLEGCGGVAVTGGNSDIEVREPIGLVAAETTTGRIRVIHATKDATLRTVNGNIYAHAAGGSLAATTVNGAIVARLLSSEVRECRLSAQNGGVTAIVAEGYPLRLDANTERGTVRCDVPVDGPVKTRRRIQGSVPGGGNMVSARTLNGNIWIARSEE